MCEANEVKVILGNYPEDPLLLKDIAEGYSIPFVDHYRVFKDLLLKGEKRKSLFSTDDSHCNAEGYAIMAKNVHEKIREVGMFGQ